MSPFRRGSVWYTEHTDETGRRRRLASEERTEKAAKLLESELRVGADRAKKGLQPGSKNPMRLTLSAAAPKYLATLRNEDNRKNLSFTVAKHVDRSGLGDLLLEHVTPAAIEEYLLGQERDGLSPATANRIRSCFSGIFRVVKKLGLFHGDNPVRNVEQRVEPEHTDRLIDPGLVLELLESAPSEDWRLFIAIAAYAGLRRGEIKRLDLNTDVDLRTRVMIVRKSKTNRIRHVGVHRDLVPMIEAARERGTVFSGRTWQKSHTVVKEAIGDEDAVFHGLRHTWSSRLVECGARVDVVDFMGWGRRKSSTFRKHYLDFPASRLVEEIDKLTWPEPTDEIGDAIREEETTAQIRHMGRRGTA